MGLKEVRPTDEPIESAVCVWCGHDISHERGVCQGCGSPITTASRIIMASPQVVAHRSTSGTPTGSPDQAARRADAVPSEGPRSSPEPSRSVHTARLVSLIVSAVPGGSEAERGRPGLVIRFFTQRGQLIAEIRPGEGAYEDALRLALG
jgi:hypothetical protein